MSITDVTPLTPGGAAFHVGTGYSILSSNTSFSIGTNVMFTGSVATGSQNLYKMVFVFYSGSATPGTTNSLGSNGSSVGSGSVMIQYSYDNANWNNTMPTGSCSVASTALPNVSGSFSTVANWYGFSYNYIVPYMRAIAFNGSGSAVTGSMIIVGYKGI